MGGRPVEHETRLVVRVPNRLRVIVAEAASVSGVTMSEWIRRSLETSARSELRLGKREIWRGKCVHPVQGRRKQGLVEICMVCERVLRRLG